MDTRTVANVESWERRPANGDLGVAADRGFSGVVRAGESYCFVVAGRPVGVFDYHENQTGDPTVTPTDVDAVSTPDEAFVAPHDALPLLYAMQATGGETRGRYYSNDTSLAEVDRTLQDGGFTGYIDLSENVLSGDYYLVYHGGTRRTVAFVGQSRRLKTDDEAFDLAADEVGIYTVERVSLPNLSFPEDVTGGAGTGGASAAGAAGGAGAASAAGAAANSEPDRAAGDSTDPSDPATAEEDASGIGTPTDNSAESTSAEGASTTAADDTTTESTASTSDIDIDITPRTRQEAEEEQTEPGAGADGSARDETAASTPDEPDTEPDIQQDAPVEMSPESSAETAETAAADEMDGDDDAEDAAGNAVGKDTDAPPAVVRVAESDDGTPAEASQSASHEASQEDVAAATAAVDDDHVVPSVDPERTARTDSDPSGNGSGPTAETAADDADAGAATADSVDTTVDTVIDGETVAGLRSELAERDAVLGEREATIETLEGELREAESENAELRQRIEELERRLEAAGAAPESPARNLTPAEALEGTSLFVRYRSKRDPTLADIAEGAAANEVSDNLRLEHHTQFAAAEVSVDGRSFDAFLTSTQGYDFVRWLVESLPYEIRDTGNADAMAELYGALPDIDRIEFDGAVEVGETTVTFDLVCRDRMGQPLLVANLEDVREPTDEATLGTLVKDATAVAEGHESLAGSFAVTSAYFEPAALETASDATSGSLLSRSKRKAFVKLSRNQGFHLALVEDRDESFYLSVPEL